MARHPPPPRRPAAGCAAARGERRPYSTDEGHYILDCAVPRDAEAAELDLALKRIAGVVEHGPSSAWRTRPARHARGRSRGAAPERATAGRGDRLARPARAIARRARQQADLAAEVVGGGEVDGLAQGHAEARQRARARRLALRVGVAAGGIGTQRQQLDVGQGHEGLRRRPRSTRARRPGPRAPAGSLSRRSRQPPPCARRGRARRRLPGWRRRRSCGRYIAAGADRNGGPCPSWVAEPGIRRSEARRHALERERVRAEPGARIEVALRHHHRDERTDARLDAALALRDLSGCETPHASATQSSSRPRRRRAFTPRGLRRRPWSAAARAPRPSRSGRGRRARARRARARPARRCAGHGRGRHRPRRRGRAGWRCEPRSSPPPASSAAHPDLPPHVPPHSQSGCRAPRERAAVDARRRRPAQPTAKQPRPARAPTVPARPAPPTGSPRARARVRSAAAARLLQIGQPRLEAVELGP